MPTVAIDGADIYYEDSGGPGEVILFSHGLLWNTTLFAPQVAALKGRYRCICYDHRGQGQSSDGIGRAIDMDSLTDDVVAIIAALGLGSVHFCGLSMGGFVGMRLAARHPALVRSLILCDTSADPEPDGNRPRYRLLSFLARWLGPGFIARKVAPIMHGKTPLSDPARKTEVEDWVGQIAKNRRSIWRAVNGVIDRAGVYDELPRIVAPTLVIVGDEDVATVPAKAERIAAHIANAKLVVIAKAGHSATVEQPAAVNAALRDFLATVAH